MNFTIFIYFVLGLSFIGHASVVKNDKIISSSQQLSNVEYPPGLTDAEKKIFWHATEGADIMPLEWAKHLKTVDTEEYIFKNLDKKYGFIKRKGDVNFPYNYIGISASWQGLPPKKQDLFTSKRTKSKSIAMVGVTCAACHTSQISVKNKETNELITKQFEGSSNLINARGFYGDLSASIAYTMANPEYLREFLNHQKIQEKHNLNHEEYEKLITIFSDQYLIDLELKEDKKDISVIKKLKSYLITSKSLQWIQDISFIKDLKIKLVQNILYEKRHITKKHLEKLFKLTFPDKELTNLLKQRFSFLAELIGQDPEIPSTKATFGRIDAFTHISNITVRQKNPLPLNAVVSIPPVWGVKYKSMFQYNSNTNSVLQRNIGQALGIGAVNYSSKEYGKIDRTSVNIHNLTKLEEYMYKLKIPNWEESFGNINREKVLSGCNIYLHKCFGCHSPYKDRVGPSSKLIHEKVFAQNLIKTDPTYVNNISKPVLNSYGENSPFRSAIFSVTQKTRDEYLKHHQISPKIANEWAKLELRGEEIFRDTYNGENRFTKEPDKSYLNIKINSSYPARHLSGIWSTAPYLHNGSISSIYELLLPSHKRKKFFFLNSNELDPNTLGHIEKLEKLAGLSELNKKNIHNLSQKEREKICSKNQWVCVNTNLAGNSNIGHEPSMYGGELSHTQKLALIEFLKVLEPLPEYSWEKESVYQIDKNWNCKLN